MASEEQKAADKKTAEENLFKTPGAEEGEAETDAFQCGRCKQVRKSIGSKCCQMPTCSQSANADIAKPRPGLPMSL
jgi:hypothetical protein